MKNKTILDVLKEEAKKDALLTCFVAQALQYYSEEVLTNMENANAGTSIINPMSWRETATRVEKLLES